MATWVLVLILTGSGKSIATIPGYTTIQECKTAEQIIKSYVHYTVCLPGPIE